MNRWRLLIGWKIMGAVVCIGGTFANRITAADCYLTPSSLVAWWPLNGIANEVRAEQATVLHGSPVFAPGVVEMGLRFDGIDDHIRVPAADRINVSRLNSVNPWPFAIELWINPDHTNSQPILEWNDGLGTSGVSLWVEAGGRLAVSFKYPGGTGIYSLVSDPAAVVPNQFQHIGVSYSPNLGLGARAALWLNGRIVSSAQTSVSGNIFAETGFDLYFGYRPSGPDAGARFAGIMDKVSLYTGTEFLGEVGFYEAGILGVYLAADAGKCSSCAVSPSIEALPAMQSLNNGTTLLLSPKVSGTKPLAYRWRLNGTNIPNATTPSYTVVNVQSNRSGIYSLVVTGHCGSASIATAVTVLPGPQILTQPRHIGLLPGQAANFSVGATGPDLTYLWFRDGSPLSGQIASNLVIASVEASHVGDYSVVVANAYYSVTSAVAKLLIGTNMLDCDLPSLSKAIELGGYYAFAGGGTILITNSFVVTNDLVIDGAGHDIVISGGQSNRVFEVGGGTQCTFARLTISDGIAERGGALFNAGGALELREVFFKDNHAKAVSRLPNPPESLGGAIYNERGTINAFGCRWEGNLSLGAPARRLGGAFISRLPATAGRGGAIFNAAGGHINLWDCTFVANRAEGGDGTFDLGISNGSDGAGGAIFNLGQTDASNCTWDRNSAHGGAARDGQPAITPSGDGWGGAVANMGSLRFTNITFHGNTVQGGVPYAGSSVSQAGWGMGGAIHARGGDVSISHATLSENAALTSGNNLGLGNSIFATGSVVRLVNSILANNISNSNGFGLLIDDGHNLSSDASCNFTNVGSLNNIDPLLGMLADNGGPSPTVALLPGSPAINAAADFACPAIDQRGVSRPQFGKCDIGAFEARVADLPPALVAMAPTAGTMTIFLQGAPLVEYCLQNSSGLLDWMPSATNVANASGKTSFTVPIGDALQLYRAIKY